MDGLVVFALQTLRRHRIDEVLPNDQIEDDILLAPLLVDAPEHQLKRAPVFFNSSDDARKIRFTCMFVFSSHT